MLKHDVSVAGVTDKALWIGNCALVDASGTKSYMLAVAMSHGIVGWEEQVRPIVTSRGWAWYAPVEILPADIWKKRYPFDKESAALIASATLRNAPAFGQLRASAEVTGSQTFRTDPLLKLEECTLPSPLGDQFGVWPKRHLPEGVAELLFATASGTNTTEATQPTDYLRTWALIDGAKVPLLPSLLVAADLPHACLFPSDDAEFAAVAPWLVELDAESDLTTRLFSTHPETSGWWTRNAAIFMRGYPTTDQLLKHLKRLVKLRTDAGQPLFFRFWDPDVAHGYLEQIADWPERVVSLLYSPHARIDEVIVPSIRAGTMRRFILDTEAVRSLMPAGAPVLQARDRAILAQSHSSRFEAELADWLLRADQSRFRPFSTKRRLLIARHAIHEGRALGLTYKEEIAYFLYMMFYLGGWFHHSPHLERFAKELRLGGEDRYARMRIGFPADFRHVFGSIEQTVSGLFQLRDRIKHCLSRRGGWDQVVEQDARDLAAQAERFILATPEDLAAGQAIAAAEARALGLTNARDVAIHYCFWLILGARFQADPLFPWVGEKLTGNRNPEIGLRIISAYALRRIDRTLAMVRRGEINAEIR